MTEYLNDPEWLTQAYECGPNEEVKRADIDSFMDWLFKGAHWAEINAILGRVDLTRLPVIFMISLVRPVSTGRSELSNWDGCVLRIRDELLRRGETREQVLYTLRGLVDDQGELIPDDTEELAREAQDRLDRARELARTMASTDSDGITWWSLLLKAPESTLDPSMFPLIQNWSNPPRAIEILEVLDSCIYYALCSDWIVILFQTQLEEAILREQIQYEDLIPLATWRNRYE